MDNKKLQEFEKDLEKAMIEIINKKTGSEHTNDVPSTTANGFSYRLKKILVEYKILSDAVNFNGIKDQKVMDIIGKVFRNAEKKLGLEGSFYFEHFGTSHVWIRYAPNEKILTPTVEAKDLIITENMNSASNNMKSLSIAETEKQKPHSRLFPLLKKYDAAMRLIRADNISGEQGENINDTQNDAQKKKALEEINNDIYPKIHRLCPLESDKKRSDVGKQGVFSKFLRGDEAFKPQDVEIMLNNPEEVNLLVFFLTNGNNSDKLLASRVLNTIFQRGIAPNNNAILDNVISCIPPESRQYMHPDIQAKMPSSNITSASSHPHEDIYQRKQESK